MIFSFDSALIKVNQIIQELQDEGSFIIAIDGRSASGKTTFAEKLSLPVIHTDDFFRPKNKDGFLDISEFSGNFDIIRFKSEVVDSIKGRKSIDYGVFDCSLGRIVKNVIISEYKCLVIEGAYSLHPELGEYADLKIFFDIDKETQKERIVKRNGIESFENFKNKWIPAEERYFNKYKIERLCDLLITAEATNGNF